MRRTKNFICTLDDWPRFRWDAAVLLEPLSEARRKQGKLRGAMLQLGFDERRRASLEALADDAVETSQIEGETVRLAEVRSSMARRLGPPDAALAPADAKTEGVVEVTLDATREYAAPLDAARLFRWHAALLPREIGDSRKLTIGRWRTDEEGPMQVISGRADRPTVHFEGPPAQRLDEEMNAFFTWFESESKEDGLIRSAIAHLWFVTIHPFDDGNGRIARAIADMALARDERSAERFFSMTRQIRREKSAYYENLERTQRGYLDITGWIQWFLGCYIRAVDATSGIVDEVERATHFWLVHERTEFSDRQRVVLNRLLHQFEGKLTAKKWAALAKVSIDTAARDINDLVAKGALTKNPGGSKNTSYEIAKPK